MFSRIIMTAVTIFCLMTIFLGCASEQITSARLYLREESWDKAELQLLSAMENEPENPEAYFHLGNEIFSRRLEWDKVDEMFNKAVSLNPNQKLPSGISIEAGVEEARRLFWGDYYNEGADFYNQAVQTTSREEKEEYLTIAIDALETAKMIYPDEPSTYKSLVFAYSQAGKSEMLDATLDEALARNPDDPTLMLAAGNSFKEKGDLGRAIEFLEKATTIDPSNSRVARALADCYYENDDKEGAIFAYKRAIREDPDNTDLHFNLGVLYIQVGDFDFAEDEFKNVLKLNPDDRDALMGIGEAYEQREKWEDSEYYYERALKLDPDSVYILRAMARVIYRQGRREEAEDYLARSKELQ